MIKDQLLLLPLPPLLSKKPGIFPLCGGNGYPMHAGRFWPSFQTLFETREPYSWYSTAGLENWNHILLKFSSFLRNFWTETNHPRIIKIHSEKVRSVQWWYLYRVIISNFSCNFLWYQSYHSMSTLIFQTLWQRNDTSRLRILRPCEIHQR